jgi:hypothetical protein
MKLVNKCCVVCLVIFVAGWLVFPIEQKMHAEFREKNLLPQPLTISTREKIGQTSSAVALGGLQNVVATFLNLRAYSSFENRDWIKLEDQFNTIVLLQPRNSYYWDVGAWHLSYNAAVDYLENEDLPVIRRKALHRKYVEKGVNFLERGTKNLPDDWMLLSSLGRFLSAHDKYPNYEKAALAYEKAWLTGKARRFEARAWLYSLARIEGKELDALRLARNLFENESNRVDTVRCLLFVLESSQPNSRSVLEIVAKCFSSESAALKALTVYRDNNADQMPTTGIDYAIELLKVRETR